MVFLFYHKTDHIFGLLLCYNNAMFTLNIDGKSTTYETPQRLIDLVDDPEKNFFLARINGRPYELHHVIFEDATVEFLDLLDAEAIYTYEASLRYLLTLVLYQLYPNARYKMHFSVSRGVYIGWTQNAPKISLKALKRQLTDTLDAWILKDEPILRQTVSKKEAETILTRLGFLDKLSILPYRNEDTVHLYQCKDFYNYMYHHLVPSTGYLKKYRITLYHPGLLIEAPRAEFNGDIPSFRDEPVFKEMLKDASRRAEILNAETIPDVNDQTKHDLKAFIKASEATHKEALEDLLSYFSLFKDVRLIALTGPSSSGKTTFTKRLESLMQSNGLKTVMISLDHYYLNRDQIPLKNGEKDFESIYGLDIDRFQKDIKSLIHKGSAKIPSFDFVSGKRISETPLKMDQDTYILIEGIHALNPLLTDHLDPKLLFKIFISPHLQMRLDDHNPLRITVVRLLRRMVRDVAFRGTDIHTTLSMWPSVRDGEFTWIYPYLEEADYVFNSSLSYEMGVLKPLVEESLKTIDKKDPHYITANRLLKTIKYFTPIDINEVPNDSILREFIGGLKL